MESQEIFEPENGRNSFLSQQIQGLVATAAGDQGGSWQFEGKETSEFFGSIQQRYRIDPFERFGFGAIQWGYVHVCKM